MAGAPSGPAFESWMLTWLAQPWHGHGRLLRDFEKGQIPLWVLRSLYEQALID